MKKIISKTVIAYRGTFLEENDFGSVSERSFGYDWKYRTKDKENNLPKKTILSPTGFGSQSRTPSIKGILGLGRDESETSGGYSKGVGSGNLDGGRDYNEGIGYSTPIALPDGENQNPYFGADHLNYLWNDVQQPGQDDSKQSRIKHDIDKTLRGPSVVPPHNRYNVDTMRN